MRKYNKETGWKTLRKGLKKVNIGQDVWRIGRSTNKKGKLHQVIYGPDDREYHLYGEEVQRMFGQVNRDGNKADQAKVKVYILTEILDKRENWCFDLRNKPKDGKLKVVYNNGTVKNIEFDGVWKSVKMNRYHEIHPVGYRII